MRFVMRPKKRLNGTYNEKCQPRGNRVHCTQPKNHHERLANAVYHRMGKMVSERGRGCARGGGAGAGIDGGNGQTSGKRRRVGSLSAASARARQEKPEEGEEVLRWDGMGCREGVDVAELEGGGDTQRDTVGTVVFE